MIVRTNALVRYHTRTVRDDDGRETVVSTGKAYALAPLGGIEPPMGKLERELCERYLTYRLVHGEKTIGTPHDFREWKRHSIMAKHPRYTAMTFMRIASYIRAHTGQPFKRHWTVHEWEKLKLCQAVKQGRYG